MKRVLKASALLMLLCCLSISVQAQKFGYLNSAEILAEMPEVKQADANLEALQKQLQKRGQAMVEKLQQDYLTAQQQMERGELSPKQQEETAQSLKAREMEIANFEQDMMKQVQDKRSELLEPIYGKINTAIQEVAEENGYQMIFDQTILLFAEDSMDVSNLVRAKLGI